MMCGDTFCDGDITDLVIDGYNCKAFLSIFNCVGPQLHGLVVALQTVLYGLITLKKVRCDV